MSERREYRQGQYVYLLDDNDHTAWIKQGHIGRCKTYRIPSSVNIEGLPYTITSVEFGAFKCQHTLQHLIFPDTIDYIDEDEFSHLPNLRSVYIGKGVQYLNNWHFRCCPKLHTITIDRHNPYLRIQNGLVLTQDGTTLLRSLFRRRELIIPEGVTRVEKVAFWYDDKLESITFPTSICEIGDSSFSDIPNLKRVVISEGAEKRMCKIVSELLLIALLVLGSCSHPCQVQTSEAVLQSFYNCSTVDWALIDTLYYRPYNCDWTEEIGTQIHPNFPPEYSARYWHRLQNAKTYLHQQTLPLRSGASGEFVKQLNRTESALDSVFVHIVSQEYYMRIFVDCYEEIMPQEITKCFEKRQK